MASSSGSTILQSTPENCEHCSNHGWAIPLSGHEPYYCRYRKCRCDKCALTTDNQRVKALKAAMRQAEAEDVARTMQLGQWPTVVHSPSGISQKHGYNRNHQHMFHLQPHAISAWAINENSHALADIEIATRAMRSLSVTFNEQQQNQTKVSAGSGGAAAGGADGTDDGSAAVGGRNDDGISGGNIPTSAAVSSSPSFPPSPLSINDVNASLQMTQDIFLVNCQKLLDKFCYPCDTMPLMYAILKDARTDFDEASRRIQEGVMDLNELFLHDSESYYQLFRRRNQNFHNGD